jgi:ankyrin repeat protein
MITSLTVSAQENIFLKRDFWKTNPSISTIDKFIAEGNDISELNINAFDGVVYALLENVDNKTIKYLLSKKGNEMDKITHDGRTYIFWAAYKNNLEIMKHLLSNGAKTDVVDTHGYTYMNFAASTGQTNPKLYDLCFQYGANPRMETNHDGANVLLLVAPSLKDPSLLNYFVDKGVALNSTDKFGNGLFNYAARTGNRVIMEYAIEKGLPYKEPTKDGGNAMIFASRGTRSVTNTLATYQYLEWLGIDSNVTTTDGVTPLHSIAYRGKDKAVFRYFLSKGVDVNQADKDGNTPFSNAALLNDVSIVKLLYPNVDDIDHKDKEGRTALTNAIRRNSLDVVNFLIENNADVNVIDAKGNHLAYYLIQSYNPKKFEEFQQKADVLASNGLNLSAHQKDGNTLYHLALETNDMKLLQWVREHDVDINVKNKNGLTALHKAAMTAQDDVMLKYLLSIGADKDIKTDFEESVYDLAAENELLKKNNIDIQFLK